MRSGGTYKLVIIVILLAAQFYPAAASSSQESLQEPSYISTGTAAALANVSHLSMYGLSGNEITQPLVNPTPLDGHLPIPRITEEETQDENITDEDVQASLQSPETSVPETSMATETGAIPEKQSIWFYLVVAILILMTGLGAAYVLRKKM